MILPPRAEAIVSELVSGNQSVSRRANGQADSLMFLLEEAITSMIAGEMDTGRSLMRNYINATVGFPELSKRVHIGKTSLMRMFGQNGNPPASNLFGITAVLRVSAPHENRGHEAGTRDRPNHRQRRCRQNRIPSEPGGVEIRSIGRQTQKLGA